MKKYIKLLLCLVISLGLFACSGNDLDKVETQLQGKWVCYWKEGVDAGACYEFLDGNMNAYIYMSDQYTPINKGIYAVTADGIKAKFSDSVKVDEGGNVTKNENTNDYDLLFTYSFENGSLKVYYVEENGNKIEMEKK